MRRLLNCSLRFPHYQPVLFVQSVLPGELPRANGENDSEWTLLPLSKSGHEPDVAQIQNTAATALTRASSTAAHAEPVLRSRRRRTDR